MVAVLFSSHFVVFAVVFLPLLSNVAGFVFRRNDSSVFFVFSNTEKSLEELKDSGNRLKLPEFSDKLSIVCKLVDKSNWSLSRSKELTEKYASIGLQPYVTFKNKTWWKTYRFPQLEKPSESWHLEIRKNEFLQSETDVIFEPWFITMELGRGLDMFETKGILILDVLTNFSRNLGDVVDASSAMSQSGGGGDMVMKQAPCNSDISFLLPFRNRTASVTGGCLLGVTFQSFAPNTSLVWLDLCSKQSKRSLCSVFPHEDCNKLRLLDLIVTRSYLVLATSFGLVRSASFGQLIHSENTSTIEIFQEISFPFTNDTSYDDLTLHYTSYCLDFHIFDEDHDIFYILDSRSRNLVYKSHSPFTRVLGIIPLTLPSMSGLQVLGIVNDLTKNTRIVLCLVTHAKLDRYIVVVISQTGTTCNSVMFPPWFFPQGSVATSLQYHTWSNTLFVYGSQVWQSRDGGNTFDQLTELTRARHVITTVSFPRYGDTIVALTNHGTVLRGRIGVSRLVAILHQSSTTDRPFTLLVGELENIVAFYQNKSLSSSAVDRGRDMLIGGYYVSRTIHPEQYQNNFCNHDILLQFLSQDEILLFVSTSYGDQQQETLKSYCFGANAFGQVFISRSGGAAHITEVTHLSGSSTSGFLARVRGKVVEEFVSELPPSKGRHSDLHVKLVHSQYYGMVYEVSSLSDAWFVQDEGKTLVLSNGLSILLKKYVNQSVMYALPPYGIPASLLPQGTQPKQKWQLYDIRSGKLVLQRTNESLVVTKRASNEGFEALSTSSFNQSHIGKILMISNNIFGVIATVDDGGSRVTFLNNSILREGSFLDWSIYEAPLNVSGLSTVQYNTGYGMWWVEEEQCAKFPIVTPKKYKLLYHLDSRDNITLEFAVLSKHLKETHPQITMFVSNPSLFTIHSTQVHSSTMHSILVNLERKPGTSGLSQMSFSVHYSSLQCPSSSNILTMHGGCPPSKRLVFKYPFKFTPDKFLHGTPRGDKGFLRHYKLPPNYRPPSSRGVGIPMSSNLYNVYPEKPPYKEKFAISRETRLYKQCAGKSSREECPCDDPDYLNMSSLVMHSDCINTVYRIIFQEAFKPRFSVMEEDANTKSFRDPYYLVELNHRSDYHVLRGTTMVLSGQRTTVFQDSLNSSLEFSGSGLYHFRAYAVKESYTLCDLTDEFIVFVDEMPLPHPARDIVRVTTAMAFVSACFFAYLWYFYLAKKGELNQVFGDA